MSRGALIGLCLSIGAASLLGCGAHPASTGPAAPLPPPPPLAAAQPAAPLAGELVMTRGVLFSGASEPPDFALYSYLLFDRSADLDKRKAALAIYLCEFSAHPSRYGAGAERRGVLLLPLIRGRPPAADVAALIDDYDYSLAHDILRRLVDAHYMTGTDLKARGIYFASFDAPVAAHPDKAAIYDISPLPTPRNITDWMLSERETLESGGATAVAGARRVPQTPKTILDGLGCVVIEMAHIAIPVASADTTACH
jgi:hypothetical protein